MMSKNNWYKIAIKQKELYEFYSLGALSDETFSNHPELLYDFINKINAIRDYYLGHLLNQIGGELHYVKPTYGEVMVPNSEESKEFYNEVNRIILKLEKCSDNLESCNLTNADFNQIMYYFNELKWSPAFGGKLWGDITYWVEELYNFKSIINTKYSPNLIKKIRGLFMILDTINSLHHNTGSVLNDLPDDEFQWLIYGLENIKDAKNPIELAYLSGNKELANIYKREEDPFFERTKTIPNKMKIRYQVSKMTKEERKNLAKITHDHLILDVLMESLGHDIFTTQIFTINPYIAAHSFLIEKLVNKMEKMDYDYKLIRENLYTVAESEFITNETAEFIMNYMSKFPWSFNEFLSELLIENSNINIDEDEIRNRLGLYIE